MKPRGHRVCPRVPLRLPARLQTIAGARVDFACNGSPWTLGLARVEPLDDEWLQWPPFCPDLWDGMCSADPTRGNTRARSAPRVS